MNRETPVPQVAFSHVGLFVHDLALMVDFHHRVLGFTITDRGELETPAGRVELVFPSRDPREHHPSTGAVHDETGTAPGNTGNARLHARIVQG